MTLTDTTGPLHAARDVLVTHLPSRYRVEVDEAELDAPSVTLHLVTSPAPQWFALLAGPDKASMLVQVTIHDSTREATRLVGDRVRHILTGVTRRNRLLTPLTAPGYRFDNPTTVGDGRADTTAGVHTWVETYRLTWQIEHPPADAPVIE